MSFPRCSSLRVKDNSCKLIKPYIDYLYEECLNMYLFCLFIQYISALCLTNTVSPSLPLSLFSLSLSIYLSISLSLSFFLFLSFYLFLPLCVYDNCKIVPLFLLFFPSQVCPIFSFLSPKKF